MTSHFLKISLLAAVITASAIASAAARPGEIGEEAYACTSWAGAHEYSLASLTKRGGRIDKNCPIRIPKGSQVEVTNEDDDGFAVVTYRGKTWWIDDARLK